jgi:hypothetical protein
MRTLLRLVLVLVVVVGVGSLLLGYWGGYRRGAATVDDRPAGTSGTIDTSRAREIGAEAGERAAQTAARAKSELDEAAVTTRIRAKMALDERVPARSVDVSTSAGIVTLTGMVPTAEAKERAGQLARETAGVASVDNRLIVAR